MSKGGTTTSSMPPELVSAITSNVNYANEVASRPFQPYAGPFNASSYLGANPDLNQAYQSYLKGFQPAATAAVVPPRTSGNPGVDRLWEFSPDARPGAATPAAPQAAGPMSIEDWAKQHYLNTGFLEGRSGGPDERQRVADFTTDQLAGFDAVRAATGNNLGLGWGVAQGAAAGLQGYNPLEKGFGHGVASGVSQYQVGQIADADLSKYMNPFTQSVIDTTANQINRQNKIALNNVGSQALSQGAYGGSRQGVAQAETNRGNADTLAGTVANLNLANFGQAQQAAAQDIGFGLQGQQLKLDAARQMMDSATARNNAMYGYTQAQLAAADQMRQSALSRQEYDLNNASALMTIGNQQQANQQAILDARYQEFLRAAGYPVETVNTRQIPLNGALPQQQYTPSNTGATLGGIGSLAMGAAALFSDRRVKTDVTRVGMLDNGLPVYAFRYVWGGPVQIGVMAQDVEKVNPAAVAEIGGIKAVNYAMATGGA